LQFGNTSPRRLFRRKAKNGSLLGSLGLSLFKQRQGRQRDRQAHQDGHEHQRGQQC
jgi:hypothetical protein